MIYKSFSVYKLRKFFLILLYMAVLLTFLTVITCYYYNRSKQLLYNIHKNQEQEKIINNIHENIISKIGQSCSRIVQNDIKEIEKAIQSKNTSLTYPSGSYIKLARNCTNFLSFRGYIYHKSFISDNELNYPIAFAILVYKDIGQVERLLRAIYRPQNIYCLHADSKMDPEDFKAIQRIVSCLSSNVFIAKSRINVKWGRFSLLESDLVCMKELWERRSVGWKYYLNLAGQEFPLRTNRELVEILKIYNGANNIFGTVRDRNLDRIPEQEFGFDVIWTKGSFHITASIGFVNFTLNDARAKMLLDVLRERDNNTWTVPDEQFYTTLNHNPKSLPVPGAYLGTPESGWLDPKLENVSSDYYPFMTRLKHWGHLNFPCKSGLWVRTVCIFGVKDLPYIVRSAKLFVNKFYYDFQPAALDCLEKYYWEKVKHELETKSVELKTTFYKNLVFVKNHLK